MGLPLIIFDNQGRVATGSATRLVSFLCSCRQACEIKKEMLRTLRAPKPLLKYSFIRKTRLLQPNAFFDCSGKHRHCVKTKILQQSASSYTTINES